MELAETIDALNEQLLSEYGRESLAEGQPRFRIVWSNDQFEKRWTKNTDAGFELIHPEVRLLPKYRHYIQDKYILERLVPVDENNTDLVEKVSYEPAWVFETSDGAYLPPRYDACVLIIDALHQAAGSSRGFAKYKDPEVSAEFRKERLDKMEKTLFGNETSTGDALAHKYGVTNPAEPHHFQQTDSVKPETVN